MKGNYLEEEISTIKEAINQLQTTTQVNDQKIKKNISKNVIHWTALEVLKIALIISQHPNQSQDKWIKFLKENSIIDRTESSIKEFIKRFNREYTKSDLLKMANWMIKNKKDRNFFQVIEEIEAIQHEEIISKLAKGIIDPPDSEFDKLAKECLNQSDGRSTWDYSPKVMMLAFPELKETFDDLVKEVQRESGQSYQYACNRLIYCSLSMQFVKESVEDNKIMWSKEEDMELLESLRRDEQCIVKIFERNKGKQNVERRIQFLKKLQSWSSKSSEMQE